MKLPLLRTLITLLFITGVAQRVQAQTFGAGDLVFTGINIYDDNNNGTVQNDAFSFVLLRDCPANTIIYFTDLGWTGSGFQSLNCAAGQGSQTDGVIQWTPGATAMRAGQQVVISCKFGPVANIGTAAAVTPTVATAATSPKHYIDLGLAGDQLFAFTGNINSPTLIAGINVNQASWDATLGSCDFTSSQSVKPTETAVLKFPNVNAINSRYNCSVVIGTAANLRTQLYNMLKWTKDNTLAAPSPLAFDLIKTLPCNLTVVNPDVNGIVYVNNQSATPGDGSSWTAPLPELRDALNAAADPVNNITQIWVAKGIYKPATAGVVNLSFAIPSNIAIYGGFAGNEATIAARNIPANPVILSGDLGGDDVTVNNIVRKTTDVRGSNSQHVITLSSTGAQTLLDGVIITGGGPGGIIGGGILNNNGNIKIFNTQFYGNLGAANGGAIYSTGTGTIEIANSIFFGNLTGGRGGAICNAGNTLSLTNVTISGNSAGTEGAGVAINSGTFISNNSIISRNTATGGFKDTYFSTGTINHSILDDQYYTSFSTHAATPVVQFTDFANGDLRLTTANYGINQGDPQTNIPAYAVQAGTKDLAGQPRISNTVIDLGAFEYQAVSQTTTFPALGTVVYGVPDIDPQATTTGDATMVYSSDNTAVVDTLAGKLVIKGVGTAVITATAPATNAYLPGAPVTRSITVTKKALNIQVDDVTRPYGTANPDPTFTYTGFAYDDDSTKAITGTISATYGGNINSPVANYTISINLSAAAAANYNMTGINGTLTITQAAQTITFPAITGKTYGDAPFTLGATSDGSLTVAYTVTSGPATVSGNTVTITGTGDVTITANQAGDVNHTAATPVSQTFTVAKATLTVTGNDKNRAYKQANPTLDYTITGFVYGENTSVVTGEADISTTADISSPADTYPISVTIGDLVSPNYLFSFVNGNLVVDKAPQVITFPALTGKTYGDIPFALGASSDGGLNITYTVTGPATISGNMLTITGTGSVTVTATQTGDENHDPAVAVPRTFSVAQAVLTVTPANKQRLYGQNNPALTFTYSGLVNGDDNSVVTGTPALSTTADLNSAPTDYPITVTNVGSLTATNYQIVAGSGTLTVLPAPQIITFPVLSNETYGVAPITLAATSNSGLTLAYSVVSGPATVSGNTLTITGIGDVTIAADQAGDGNHTPAAQATQTFTVGKAELTVTANHKTKVYLEPNPTPDYTITGLVNGDPGSVVSGAATINHTAVQTSVPGSYPINVTAGNLTAANYTFTYVNGLLDVSKAAQTITFPAITDKTYGAVPFALTATSDAGLTVTYSVASGPATVSGNMVTITGTGPVTIAADQAGNGNYTAAAQVTQAFNVDKATLMVTANHKTKVYQQPNPTPDYTITGFVYNEPGSVVSGQADISHTAVLNSVPGSYPITVTIGNLSAANYTFNFTDGALDVTKATQTITFGALANKTYGDAPFTVSASSDASLTIAYSVVSGPATISGNTVTITGAGTVTIGADQAGDANYSAATQATQAFTVNKATLTVTANHKTKVYLQPNPTPDYTITGFVNGEPGSVVTGTADISHTADLNSVVGNYPINVSAGRLSATNYIFTYVDGSLDITQAAQTITFPAIANKTYGAAPFTLNASTNSGLTITYSVASGPATISGNTVTITGAGPVTIAADQAGDGNFTAATQATQSFNIDKATLTVTANHKTKIYLQPNPTPDYTITGFVYNETSSVVTGNATTVHTAVQSSVPGSYPITVTAGTLSAANYTFSFVDGTLDVTLSPQTITFAAIATQPYGVAPFTLNALSDAGLTVTYSVVSGPATISGNIVTITGTGAVTIAADQAGNTSYDPAAQVTHTFNVDKVPLTVTANHKTKVYLQPNPTPDYTITGFVYNETTNVVNGEADISTTADINSVPGSYPITVTAGGLTAANYTFNFINNTLDVTKGTQIITFPAITDKTYGAAPFTLNASTNSGLTVTYSVASGPATISGNTVTITGAGPVTIAADQAGDGNYTAATQATQSFNVDKATLTVTANHKTKIYLQPNPTPDYTITGFVYNETSTVVTGNATTVHTAVQSSVPGSYPITVTAGTLSAANYTFSFVDGTLDVTLSPQTITFAAIADQTYGVAPFTLNAASNAGLTVAYSVVSGPATITGNTVTITGAGAVTIAADQPGNTSYDPAAQVTRTFNVDKVQLTVTANHKTKVYLQPNPTPDYTITGFVNNETTSVVNGDADIITTADINSVPGSYPITVTIGRLTAANYTFSFINNTLDVTKGTQIITFPAITDKTYGAAPFTLNASTNSGLTVTYSVASGPATISGNTVTITGAGPVTIAADQAGDGNYTAATQATQSFNVDKATLTVTANHKTKIYLQPNPTPDYTITGFVYNETSTVVTGNATTVHTAVQSSVPGSYPITVTAGTLSAANYTFSFVDGTLDVTLSPQTITFAAIADQTYGVAPFTLNAASNAGLTVAYSVVSGPATITGNTVTITGAGAVTIAADQPGNTSYDPAAQVTRTFNVDKVQLTVTANHKTKVYLQPNPVIDYTITGFVNNETTSVVSGIANITTTADINSVPGSYPITVTAGSLSAANYTFSFVNNTLDVAQGTQTITFPAITNKTYGDAPFVVNASSDAGLTVAYSVVSGPATISGNTVTITGAGIVTIAANQAGDGNYTPATQVTQMFTVNKAVLTVTANNKSKIYLQPNPAIDYTITGFVNNENNSVVSGAANINTAATINSTPDTYPITVSAGTLSAANYTFSFVNGTLTVTLTTQIITFPAISGKTYGDAPFALNATSSSGLPVSYTVVSGPATISGSTVTITGAGSVTIAADQAGNGNYEPATPATQTFSVAKTTLTVKATNDTRSYTGTAYTGGNGAVYTGLVNGDDATKLGGTLTYTGTSQGAVNAGTYIITPSGFTSNNYSITYADGQLTITKAAQQITFTAIGNKNEGDPDFTLVATSNSGLPVTFGTDNAQVISINGATAHVGIAGTVHISASQAGNSNYEAATTEIQTIEVTAYTAPVITAQGTLQFCDGNTVTLQSSSAPAYEWYRNNILVPGANSGTLTVDESGSYTVKAIYNNNVGISSAAVTVTVHPLPVGNVVANGNTTISKGATIGLSASGGNTYVWDPALGLNNPNIAAPVARPATTTTYKVAISNTFGCSITKEITITVLEDFKLEGTNILTPNGDGKNDMWVVKNIDMYPQNEVKIFDRSGRLIYQKRGYTNNWNGTVNGQPLAEGTYYYIISLGDNKPTFKGFITIIHEN